MAYESGSFEAAIAAAAGDDLALRRELLGSFQESLSNQLDLLRRARCDGNWSLAANRLRGLGASFHDGTLVYLGEFALESAPGDPVAIRQIAEYAKAAKSRS